jgi:hypothetical protein
MERGVNDGYEKLDAMLAQMTAKAQTAE